MLPENIGFPSGATIKWLSIPQARKDKKAAPEELSALEKVNAQLELGKPARLAGLSKVCALLLT